jgi:hypothetical protein
MQGADDKSPSQRVDPLPRPRKGRSIDPTVYIAAYFGTSKKTFVTAFALSRCICWVKFELHRTTPMLILDAFIGRHTGGPRRHSHTSGNDVGPPKSHWLLIGCGTRGRVMYEYLEQNINIDFGLTIAVDTNTW